MRKSLIRIAISVALLVSITGCGMSNSTYSTYSPDSFESAEPEPTPTAELRWAPKSFTQLDESIAYKFTTNKGPSPCDYCSFWKVTVIANQNCTSGVYAELNIKDSSGTVVDWTNDSIPYLGAGQKAVLTFETYSDEDVDTGELTKLTCY